MGNGTLNPKGFFLAIIFFVALALTSNALAAEVSSYILWPDGRPGRAVFSGTVLTDKNVYIPGEQMRVSTAITATHFSSGSYSNDITGTVNGVTKDLFVGDGPNNGPNNNLFFNVQDLSGNYRLELTPGPGRRLVGDTFISYRVLSFIDDAYFERYENLPTAVSPGKEFNASIVMSNPLGGSTWKSGIYKLGNNNALLKTTWQAPAFISLDSDVLPGRETSFTATFKAPVTTGTYDFGNWQMTEGTKWFGSPSTNQQIQVMAPAAVCGDSIVNGAEQCDLGVGNGACPSTCSAGCALNACSPPVVCGDGVVNGSEECDNGVGGNGGCPNTCSNSCTNNTCNTINIGTFKEVAP